MQKNEDLLNLTNNNKKDFKKPLIIGAAIFIIFVVGVVIAGIMSSSENKKEDNVIIPPKQDNQLFKEVPIEEPKTQSLTKKLLEKENTPEEKPTPKPQPKEKQPPAQQPKQPTTPQKVEKPTPKPQPTTQKSIKENKTFYIQVAALMKSSKPNPKFLKIIEKNGFKYKIVTVKIKKNNKVFEVKKILIGPFTQKEAKEKLKAVKAKINQNAFIFRMK